MMDQRLDIQGNRMLPYPTFLFHIMTHHGVYYIYQKRPSQEGGLTQRVNTWRKKNDIKCVFRLSFILS